MNTQQSVNLNEGKYMSKEQVGAMIQIVAAVGEAIRDLTAKGSMRGVPSGHLYARLMAKLSLEQYNSILAILQRQGLVKNENHFLTWIGPVA